MKHPGDRVYQRLKAMLQQSIETGRFKPGDQVPSEREISESFGVSRMTVRHALTELVNEGVLYRQQGKGTFVTPPEARRRLMGLTSYSDDMRRLGKVPGAKLLSVQQTAPPKNVRCALRMPKCAPVLRVERLLLADNEPMALQTVYLPERFCTEAVQASLAQVSITTVLVKHSGVKVRSATQSLKPGQADADQAQLLAIPEGALLLVSDRITFDEHGIAVTFTTTFYRADRYQFVVELLRR